MILQNILFMNVTMKQIFFHAMLRQYACIFVVSIIVINWNGAFSTMASNAHFKNEKRVAAFSLIQVFVYSLAFVTCFFIGITERRAETRQEGETSYLFAVQKQSVRDRFCNTLHAYL